MSENKIAKVDGHDTWLTYWVCTDDELDSLASVIDGLKKLTERFGVATVGWALGAHLARKPELRAAVLSELERPKYRMGNAGRKRSGRPAQQK